MTVLSTFNQPSHLTFSKKANKSIPKMLSYSFNTHHILTPHSMAVAITSLFISSHAPAAPRCDCVPSSCAEIPLLLCFHSVVISVPIKPSLFTL